MKKILYYLGIVLGIVIILVSLYVLFKIYFVMQVHNGQMYDGFGTLYVNEEPRSPYTIFGVIGFFGGTSLVSYGYKNLKLQEHS